MPGSVKEIKHAQEEGVQFLFNSQPLEIIGNGKVKQLKIGETRLGEADDSGRRKPVLVEGSERILDIDKLVIAFGYEADPQNFIAENNIDVSDRGLISLENQDYKYQTSVNKFFAAGDSRRGQSLVVWAIKEGRQCARSIDEFLMGKSDLLI